MYLDKFLSVKIKGVSFVLILMVIYIHSYNINIQNTEKYISITSNIDVFLQNLLSQGMFRSAVPMFFSISGFLFFKNYNSINDYKKKVISRFKTIFIPFVFWNILVILIYYITQLLVSSDIQFNSVLIKDLSIYDLIKSIFFKPYNYPLWFLRDLMIVVLIAPVIYIGVRKFTLIWFFVVIMLWLLDIGSGAKFYFFKSEVVFFFSIGAYLALLKERYLHIIIKPFAIKSLIIFYMLVLLLKTYLLSFSHVDIFLVLLMQKIIIIVGIYLFWVLFDYQWIAKFRIVKYTFLFYVFHEPLLMLSEKIAFYQFGMSVTSHIVFYLLCPLIIVLLLCILGFFSKRYFSKVVFVITGGRM